MADKIATREAYGNALAEFGAIYNEVVVHATFCKDIPRDIPLQCQLPDEVPLSNGRALRRPSAWS